MKQIIYYLLALFILISAFTILFTLQIRPLNLIYHLKVPVYSLASAEYGGLLYLFRAIYLNKCVNKNWDEDWKVWYYIRPITSFIAGGAAYLFISAGLIIFESNQIKDSTNFGLYALSFIAGLNVDNFIKKIEDISKTIFGIEKSRQSDISNNMEKRK